MFEVFTDGRKVRPAWGRIHLQLRRPRQPCNHSPKILALHLKPRSKTFEIKNKYHPLKFHYIPVALAFNQYFL